jgi:V8-like Glu-specific endopeptidase
VVSTPAGTGTGTLIGSRYVLTAAHVVGEEYKNATPNITVRLGAGSNRRDYSVQYVMIPPSYLQLMNSEQLSKLWKDGIPET